MLRSSTTPFLARLKSGRTHQRIRNGMAVYATWMVVWTSPTDYQAGLQIEQVLHHSRDSLMSYLFKPLDYLEQATPQIVRNRYHQALPHPPRSHALSNDFDPKLSLTPRRHISDDNFARLNRHGPSTRHRRGFSFRPGDDTKPADPHSAGLEPLYRAGFSEPDTTQLAARISPVSISLASDTTCDLHRLHREASQHTTPSPRDVSGMQTSSPSSTLGLPQRDDSGRSTVTVIRHIPSISSSASNRDALTSSCDFQWQESRNRMTHNASAVAAARAACEGPTKASGKDISVPVGR